MSNRKEIYQYSEVKDKILGALTKVTRPVVQTLTPKGRNVLYQDQSGQTYVTNDGFKILQNITLSDPVENAVAEIVKHASFKTNSIAGDGTTTTMLLSENLIRNGLRLIEAGFNPMDLTRQLDEISKLLLAELDTRKTIISGDKDLEFIARISANNDSDVSANVVKVINKAGQDGLVFIEDSTKDGVEIIEEDGFVLEAGMFAQHFANQPGKFAAQYEDVMIFITDKRLYYDEECIALLEAVKSQGESKVVIVAADFIGNTPNIFISNHVQQKMNILLIKEDNGEVLEDLAAYVGGRVLSEKQGALTDQLNQLDFRKVKKIFADARRTVILSGKKDNATLVKRIEAIRAKIDETERDSGEQKGYKKRLACLTNGIVTIKVGGKTVPEIRERLYRYEDSINATRNALKEGYVPGGGITLLSVFDAVDLSKYIPELRDVVKRYCEAPLKQIAENCNVHFQTLLEKVDDKIGYNAMNGKFEDLVEAGVIEPVIVLRQAIENSNSVAGVILSSDYIIVNIDEDEED